MDYKDFLKLLIACLSVTLLACNDKKEDITDSVNRAGSVETAVEVNHLDTKNDILVTTHKVWVKYDVYKTIEYRDTIPSLGEENTTAENDQGDRKNVTVPKDYEIYITVK